MDKKLLLAILCVLAILSGSAQTVTYEKLDEFSMEISRLQSSANGLSYNSGSMDYEISFSEENFQVAFSDLLASKSVYKKWNSREILALTEGVDLSKVTDITWQTSNGVIVAKLYFPYGHLRNQILEEGKETRIFTENYLEFFCNAEAGSMALIKPLYDLCTYLQIAKGVKGAEQTDKEFSDWSKLGPKTYLEKHANSLLSKQAKDLARQADEKGYSEAIKQGDQDYEQQRFISARNSFNKALSYKPSDEYATKRLEVVEEIIVWQDAEYKSTIAAFENYLDKYPLGLYLKQAHQRIENGLIYNAQLNADNGNVKETEFFANAYLSRYPSGNQKGKATDILCDLYYKKAETSAVIKSEYGQSEALDFYIKTKQTCSGRYDLDKKIKKARWRKREWGYPDRFFVAYLIDIKNYLGISMGGVYNGKVNGYGSLRVHHHFATMGTWTSSSKHEIKDLGYPVARFTDKTRSPALIATGGITFKAIWPLWIKVGAGMSYEWAYNQYEVYDDDGDFVERKWAKLRDRTYWGVVPDIGIILDFKGFNLHYSAQPAVRIHPDIELKMWHAFGIGFSLKQ